MKYVTVFTGAGISAESGIQTFRAIDGTWNNHKVEDVASPAGFQRDPQLVWDFYRARWEQRQTVKPNVAHYAIVELEQKVLELGYQFTVITQNVDGLHQEAGSKNVLELHGDLRTLRCDYCQYSTDVQEHWKHSYVPQCPQCQSDMRPNIVWFGEMLPEATLVSAINAAMNSHSMIVVGTSGQVFPAAQLPAKVIDVGGHVYECNIELAFTMLNMISDLYHPLRGRATVTVPMAVNQILRQLKK